MSIEGDRLYSRLRPKVLFGVFLAGGAIAFAVDYAFPWLGSGGWQEVAIGVAVLIQIASLVLLPDPITRLLVNILGPKGRT